MSNRELVVELVSKLAENTPLEDIAREVAVLAVEKNASEAELVSPAWHEQILKEREARIRSGQEKFIDWEDAKKELRALSE